MTSAFRRTGRDGRDSDGIGVRRGFDKSGKILETPGLSGRAAESIAHFLQVFFVCTAAMIPSQPMPTLAGKILAIAALSWGIQVNAQIRYAKRRAGHPLTWLIMRIVQTQLAGVPFAVAG